MYSLFAFVSTHAVGSATIGFLVSVLSFNTLSWLEREQMQLILDVSCYNAYIIVTTSSDKTFILISFSSATTTVPLQPS